MLAQLIDHTLIPHLNDPLPHDLEAERRLLREIVRSPAEVDTDIASMPDGIFYDPRHRRIFQLITQLWERNPTADLAMIRQQLMSEAGEDASYLTLVIDAQCVCEKYGDRIEVLRKLFLRRQLIDASNRVILKAMEATVDPEITADWADKIFVDLLNRDGLCELESINFEFIEAATEYYSKQQAIKTGLVDLDGLLTGLEPSCVVVVGGRTGVGKTALALAIVQAFALVHHASVCICSPGAARDKIAKRLLLARAGEVPWTDREHLAAVKSELTAAPIWVDDSPRLSAVSLRLTARRAKLHADAKCILVDDLHLLYDPLGGNRHEHWCNVARTLKMMSQELALPIVAFVRLDPESSPTSGRGLDAFGDFGSLAQVADAVLLLNRPDQSLVDKPPGGPFSRVEATVAKNRNGPTGSVTLALNAATGVLTDGHAQTDSPPVW